MHRLPVGAGLATKSNRGRRRTVRCLPRRSNAGDCGPSWFNDASKIHSSNEPRYWLAWKPFNRSWRPRVTAGVGSRPTSPRNCVTADALTSVAVGLMRGTPRREWRAADQSTGALPDRDRNWRFHTHLKSRIAGLRRL